MRNPTAEETVSSPVGAPCKDKRTLVLFLFGVLALAGNVLIHPGSETLAPDRYGVQLLPTESDGAYRVVRYPAATGEDASAVLPLDPLQPISPQVPARFALFLHQPIPINRSDRGSLEMLPGVGPMLAQAIVTSIEQEGPVSDPVALQRIAGVGPKTATRLAPMIRFH